MKDFFIRKVRVSSISSNETINYIINKVSKNERSVICVGNVSTNLFAQRDRNYRIIVNSADLNLPDGMPIVWAARCAGIRNPERVSGPDLMSRFIEDSSNLKHYFLGDTQEVLKQLEAKIGKMNPACNIVGTYSPPFRKVFSKEDIISFADKINEADADIIWVGLGSPKQDIVNYELIRSLKRGVVIGVGAAFRFYIGEYKNPNVFIQKIGLQGLFWRFRKQPLYEIKWYLINPPIFFLLLVTVFYTRIMSSNILKKSN